MTVSIVYFASQQLTIYFGLTFFIAGIIGGLLNIIIFTTLKSFRETTCVFFLIILLIVNVGQLLTTPFVFILAEGFYIDPRKISWFCKFYIFLAQWSVFISLSSLCLATIDQFLSMSKYRQWSTVRFARNSITIAATLGFLHSIFVPIYFAALNGSCTIINSTYAKYVSWFQFPVLYGCLPFTIVIVFSVVTFVNARTLHNREVNIVRLRRDRQLIAMVFAHAIYQVLTGAPYAIFYIYLLNQNSSDPEKMAQIKLIDAVTVLLAFSGFAGSFYVYCCASKRFRKQLVHVLIRIWLKRWRHWMNKQNNNVVVPSFELVAAGRHTFGELAAPENITIHQKSSVEF